MAARLRATLPTDMRTSHDRHLALFRRVMDEAFSGGDLRALDEVIRPDFVEHEVGPGQGRGLDGVKEIVRVLRAAFPDLRATIGDTFASGDRLCARVTFRGTHLGDFLGLAPTRRAVEWGAIDICRFEDDRLAEHWGQIDRLGLLEQLGATALPKPH